MIAHMPGDSTDCPWPSESDRPQRAPVPPRVCAGGKAALLLEEVIKPYLGRVGIVQIIGPAGSGKSVAIDHLVAAFPARPFLAIDNIVTQPGELPHGRLVIVACPRPLSGECLATFQMAGWTFDDCVLYLARVHREQCKSVIDRLLMDETTQLLEGSPRLLRVALDEMAEDASIANCLMALRKHLANRLSPEHRSGLAGLCLRAAMKQKSAVLHEHDGLCDPCAADLLRHHIIRVLLAADRVAEKLDAGAPTEELSEEMPLELVKEIAFSIRRLPKAMARLNELIAEPDRRFDAMAASILLAADHNWRPRSGQNLQLTKGHFADAKWQGIDLTGANLSGADLSHADLRDADLTDVRAMESKFISANLENSILTRANLIRADLTLANFLYCSAQYSRFDHATLEAANLQYGDFSHATFYSTSLRLVSFAKSALNFANFSDNDVHDADFGEAQLMWARLSRIRLRDATCVGASFQGAVLLDCDLEGMDLPRTNFFEADLSGCDLTTTHIPDGICQGAKLIKAGLADIDWPGADLRDADFTGASFHMGSSRSGLVGSTIPTEGSRTGFYTDDYNDQDFKDPEEIRKANLCNADLRGANVEKTDFYLVDLRGAKLSPDDVEHFLRSGAILRSRVT